MKDKSYFENSEDSGQFFPFFCEKHPGHMKGVCGLCFAERMSGRKQMKKILFMDDRTKRIQAALERYSIGNGYLLTIVTNAKECLRYLSKYDWDIVSLDHDMNGIDFQDPDDKDSGMEVVRYIAKTGWPYEQRKMPEFWIHSSNLFAANLMIDWLRKGGLSAYWKKFDYDEVHEKVSIPVPPDTWKAGWFGTCISCHKRAWLDIHGERCHNCDTRERVQCAQ